MQTKTAEQFCEIGELLYGKVWQSQLSRDLGFDPRRIQQWKSGVKPIPAGVWIDLIFIVNNRVADVLKAREIMDKK